MSLPSPNLDDRKFQDIVDDVKRQIGLRCPEWTDHNVSDPGVTLIELFAYMTEMVMYRVNQVPEKNYIRFLEMLGVSLEPPAPARTDLRFLLSRPIEDAPGEEAFECTLRARETVAATVRTESEEAIEFATDADLHMVRPKLAWVTAIPRPDGVRDEADMLRGARDYAPDGETAFPIFSPVPRETDALYLGFENDVSGNVIELEVECLQAAATGLDETYPSQVWEWWNTVENRWDRLQDVEDDTCGFNRNGSVQLCVPSGMMSRMVGDRRGWWFRCRYTLSEDDLPPRGADKHRPSPYQKPPEITAMHARTIGGTAPSSNCNVVLMEELGQSDETPGQVFKLRYSPVHPRRPGETILVGKQGAPVEDLEEWTEVPEFSLSGPDDRHFMCDSYAGEILFGPSIVDPDGIPHQYGAIPKKGLTVYMSAYSHGGGRVGNVREQQVQILKSSIPYIAAVVNPRRAHGGKDQESLERAKMRGRSILRMRDRAVTAEDFEFLAEQASSGVGRARCIQPSPRYSAGATGENIPPGVVRVLVVPALSHTLEVPAPADLRVPARTLEEVRTYLDRRRLLTTVLEVAEPEYLYVSTEIVLVADPRADADQVVRRVRERLSAYIHPLTGGPNGDGWPFKRSLTLADVYAQVGAVGGVAFLLDAKIFVSRLVNAAEGLLGAEQMVDNREGVPLGEVELLCTREHRIRVRPMWSVGMTDTDTAQ